VQVKLRSALQLGLISLLALLFFAAIIPFSSFSLLSIVTALIITLVNWLLGSNWVIAASELTCDQGRAKLL
jgi:hypothetical protein